MTTPGGGTDPPEERPIRPQAGAQGALPPVPAPPPKLPAAPTASPSGAADPRHRQVIRRLEGPPARVGRHGDTIIRPLVPLPPNMPGERRTVIRPLAPLAPMPSQDAAEVESRRRHRDVRLAAILRPLTPRPAPAPDPSLQTIQVADTPNVEVPEWVICQRCDTTSPPDKMFCSRCGAVLPAAARLFETLTREYEDMQSSEPSKDTVVPRLATGRRGPNWQAYGQSDKGRVRKNNEDTLLATPLPANGWLLLVADGMGGAEAGEIASQQAAEIVRELIERRMEIDANPDTDHRPWLMQAIEEANALLYREAAEDRRLHGMGTTLTAGIVQGLCLELGHAGDSRCYRLPAKGPLQQLTTDHAIVAHLLRLGQITPEEAHDHPLRNQLYRAVATAPTIEVDSTLHILEPTDKLLFCSDGLVLHLDDSEIERILRQATTPQQACRALIDLTLIRGAGDNVSVAVLMAG